ncbi:hypothetical protein B0T17DRAFT_522502 [Bombardia bombarda]|uniref:C2H2-type domain-containing protein n=1 Tax=Bombardia bombarda TaxID=252184 RepID=A0AA39X6S4_9PEZI|nr:hypothetical protein B0T17DRAFT_522502 [Bombardia bombarda]
MEWRIQHADFASDFQGGIDEKLLHGRAGSSNDGVESSSTDNRVYPTADSLAAFQQDNMDIDLDLDCLSWATDLNSSLYDTDMDPNHHYSHVEHHAEVEVGLGLPHDLLFYEDENTLPDFLQNEPPSRAASQKTIQAVVPSATPYTGTQDIDRSNDIDMEETASQRLRNQLSLLSEGSCGDELVFKDCKPSKAILLHKLAMEYGFSYNHDAKSRSVSITKIQTEAVQDNGQPETFSVGPERSRISVDDSHSLRQSIFTVESSFPSNPRQADTGNLISSSSFFEDLLQKASTPSPWGQADLTEPHQYAIPTADPFDFSHEVVSEQADNSHEDDASKATIFGQSSRSEDTQQLSRQPSRGQRIGHSISKHVSTWKTSIAKGGRRGPLSENSRRDMKVLEGVGGACWRCKVLRRKCDSGSTCRCCLQSIPTPYFGDDAPLWPLIGCRRGALRDSMPEQLLCPASRRPPLDTPETQDNYQPRRSLDIADRHVLAAESQRLSDMKSVLEHAFYKLSITDPNMKNCFMSFIEAGRYRDRDCLHKSYSCHDNTFTYSELIAVIAWELAENQALLPLLEIKSWQAFMEMLETACIYESEVSQTSLVMLSMVCLRYCLGVMRLHSAGLLSTGAHDGCGPSQCHVHYIRDLCLYVSTYIDELSSVIFNKENMRDRRWWLSTFWSMYIQSYVRHALISIEKQLCFASIDDVPAEELTSTQYLHLAAVLFTAASTKYDPLLGGRLQYALTDNSVHVIQEASSSHHSAARSVCEVDKWPEVGIKNSHQFLRKLLQIGSLDFENVDAEMLDISIKPETSVLQFLDSPSSPPWKNEPTHSNQLESPQNRSSFSPVSDRSKRQSVESGYSLASIASMSGASSISLARTFDTDMTSIYEASVQPKQNRSSFYASDALRSGMVSPICQTPLVESSDQFMAGTSTAVLEESPVIDTSIARIVCYCCPKAPQSFRSAEDLLRHEAEKPHPCSQCKKRFKSPKEAERHMNAIHLKSDYWSCQMLANPLVAFHTVTSRGVMYDICGFCGGGFERAKGENNSDDTGSADASTDRDISELVAHLESVHKHMECNQERKFYRVDNFRTHLRTAHVALPGKWLKVLERNCRTVTTPPQPPPPQ